MIIHNPILTGSLQLNGTSLSTGNIVTTGSNTFVGNQVVSGSLNVSGSVTATGTLTAQTLVVQTVTSSVVYSSGSNVFGNVISNTHQFTGSVGISGSLSGTSATFSGQTLVGTTSLATGFSTFAQIETSGTTGGILINSATNNIGRLIFTNNNTSGGEGLIRYNGSNQSMEFWTNATQKLTIASTGAATFSSSVTVATNLIAQSSTTNSLRFLYENTYNKGGVSIDYTTGEFRIYAGESGNGYFQTFYTNATEKMRITNSGNIQIPWDNNIVNIMNYDDNYRMGLWYRANSRIFTIFSTGGDGGGSISFNTRGTSATGGATDYGTERMRIDEAGVVNFNGNSTETSFNDKFSMGFSNDNYGWLQTWSGRPLYLCRVGNAVYAGTQRIDNNSDERIKENITSIPNALDTVLALNGRKFNMLDENGKLRYGFVAQEVQPHLSDFVTESDRSFEKGEIKIENLLTLESSGAAWGALLVEAIKELSAKVDTQAAEIEILKNK